MAKTKFFRIAVEGATVDGRVIERSWLEEMAAGYNPATYTARINCEHIAGYSPDKPFNAYGSVLSLKAEEIDLSINGKTEKKLALYGEVDANEQLVAINKAGQKLFTSCEIHPDFAGQGKAYLVGLAVTDSPASLGTEPLKFAAMSRPNVFTPAQETQIEVIAAAESASIADAIKNGFISLGNMFARGETQPAKVDPKPPANDNLDVPAFTAAIGEQVAAGIAAGVKPVADGLAALQAEMASVKGKLEKSEQPGFSRTPATGAGSTIQTDC